MKDGHINICKNCKRDYAKAQRIEAEFKCIVCSSITFTSKYRFVNGVSKFCSKVCMGKYYSETGHRPPVQYGEDVHNWKGDDVGYSALHDWVARQLGKPRECEHCKSKTKKVYHWANKSGDYKRDINDWIRLCVSCHSKYDRENRDIIYSFEMKTL